MIGQPGLHCWRNAKRLVDAAENGNGVRNVYIILGSALRGKTRQSRRRDLRLKVLTHDLMILR
jgi:hypothetical protein